MKYHSKGGFVSCFAQFVLSMNPFINPIKRNLTTTFLKEFYIIARSSTSGLFAPNAEICITYNKMIPLGLIKMIHVCTTNLCVCGINSTSTLMIFNTVYNINLRVDVNISIHLSFDNSHVIALPTL